MLHSDSPDDLPDCWARPISDMQGRLFTQPTAEALAALRVSQDDCNRWRQADWISFDIDDYLELDEPLISEIEFIRNVARSGLSDSQINTILEGLPKPFRFRPGEIAFHFAHGWVVPAQDAPFDVVEQNVNDWLDQLLRIKDEERLLELSEKIADNLAELEAARADGDEEDDVVEE